VILPRGTGQKVRVRPHEPFPLPFVLGLEDDEGNATRIDERA
jgi:hypothetical protein